MESEEIAQQCTLNCREFTSNSIHTNISYSGDGLTPPIYIPIPIMSVTQLNCNLDSPMENTINTFITNNFVAAIPQGSHMLEIRSSLLATLV